MLPHPHHHGSGIQNYIEPTADITVHGTALLPQAQSTTVERVAQHCWVLTMHTIRVQHCWVYTHNKYNLYTCITLLGVFSTHNHAGYIKCIHVVKNNAADMQYLRTVLDIFRIQHCINTGAYYPSTTMLGACNAYNLCTTLLGASSYLCTTMPVAYNLSTTMMAHTKLVRAPGKFYFLSARHLEEGGSTVSQSVIHPLLSCRGW